MGGRGEGGRRVGCGGGRLRSWVRKKNLYKLPNLSHVLFKPPPSSETPHPSTASPPTHQIDSLPTIAASPPLHLHLPKTPHPFLHQRHQRLRLTPPSARHPSPLSLPRAPPKATPRRLLSISAVPPHPIPLLRESPAPSITHCNPSSENPSIPRFPSPLSPPKPTNITAPAPLPRITATSPATPPRFSTANPAIDRHHRRRPSTSTPQPTRLNLCAKLPSPTFFSDPQLLLQFPPPQQTLATR